MGVNKYRLSDAQQAQEDQIEILDIDNAAVRESQNARLQKIRAERDNAAVQQALAALTDAARSGQDNLLELAVQAARSFGMSVLGFVRQNRFNIYCGESRIESRMTRI